MGIGKMTTQLPRGSKEFPMLEGVCGRRCRRIWHGAQCRHRLCLFAMASNFILLCDLLSLLCAAPPLLFSPLQCVSLRSWLGSARLWCPDVLLFWCPDVLARPKGCCCLQFESPWQSLKAAYAASASQAHPCQRLSHETCPCARYLPFQDFGYDCAFLRTTHLMANTKRIGRVVGVPPRAGDLF